MASTKKVKLQVLSLKPDRTQYKGYDVQFIPPEDQPIFVEFDVDGSLAKREDDGSITIKLEGLYEIAEEVYAQTQLTYIKHVDIRDRKEQKAMKGA